MIPYIPEPTVHVGPFSLYSFGLLVAVAVLAGSALIQRRTRHEGLDVEISTRLVTWILAGGFLGAHMVDRFVYFPADTLAHPWSILRIWEGLSSFGGFLGAILGAALFLHRARLGASAWRYVDAVAYALPAGWFFGRLGCFSAFDHPGLPTSFILGERYTDGLVRHNLGLEEALFMIPLALAFYVLGRRPRRPGFFAGLLALLYAPVRFSLDSLRVADVRYLGLTPGQYGALGLVLVGAVLLLRSYRVPSSPRSRPEEELHGGRSAAAA